MKECQRGLIGSKTEDKAANVDGLAINPCPFCGEHPFEEIWPERNIHDIISFEEKKYYRINHKETCYLNYSGEEFERFSLFSEELKYWNKRESVYRCKNI